MIRNIARRRTLLFCLLVLLSAPVLPSRSAGETGAEIVAYDRELYETGYNVFLMNGKVGDALMLAEAALKKLPNDRTWRRRAAQCADWAGEPVKALPHWTLLALVMDDREAYDRAMKIAGGLGDARTRMLLLRHRLLSANDLETVRAFVESAEKCGEVDDAIALLERLRAGEHGKFALERLFRLYRATGDPDKAITAMLDYQRNCPLTGKQLLETAELRFGRGDIQGAYQTLKGGLGTAAAGDSPYLEAAGDICWRMQDGECTMKAAEKLRDMGKARVADFQRLIFLQREKDPRKAYAAALEGCRRFGAKAFFSAVADTGERVGDWRELKRFLSALPRAEREMLSADSSYWLFRSKVSDHLDRAEEAIASYHAAMKLEPGNPGLTAGYLWLLLDRERYWELREIGVTRPDRADEAPELTDARAAVAVYLGDFGGALKLFGQRAGAHSNDPLWLSAYADVLEQNNRPEAAFGARMRGFLLVRAGLGKKGRPAEEARREQIDLARLLMQIQKGDRLDAMMERIIRISNDGAARDLALAWALSTERNDLARRWLCRSFAARGTKTDWMQLGLAMEENDRARIAEMLEGAPGRLPYRDAIEGARRIGAGPLSEELAWQRSGENPDDYLLYDQLREISSARRSFAENRVRLLDLAGIGGLEDRTRLSVPVTPRFSVFSEISYTRYKALKNGVVNNLPSGETSVTAGASAKFDKGEASLSAGWRSLLTQNPVFGASATYRPAARLELVGKLSYSAPADETVPLIVGGMKDQGSLLMSYALTPRDTLQTGYSRVYLRDRWRRLLGTGNSYTIDVSRKLHFAYPDFSVRVFGGYYDYARKEEPQGRTLALIPDGVPKNASFFVPDSYFLAGAGAEFGQGYRYGYTKSWKPFGSIDASWRNSTGVGFDLGLGIHGPLIGYDSLYFGTTISSGTAGTSNLSVIVETGYVYYFN